MASILISIISALAAIGTAVLSAVFTFIKSKRENILTIVTKGRIKYLEVIRDANARLLRYSHIDNCNKDELLAAAAILKTYLKPFYSIESKLLEALDSLTDACIAGNGENIDIIKRRYIKLYSQYDWAYWHYIQAQASGKYKNSNSDFNFEHQKLQNEIESDNTFQYDWEE